MNFSDMIKSSPFYRSMMEQIPEEDRALAESQLASILSNYDVVVSSLPGEVMTEMSSMITHDESSNSIDNSGSTPKKRAPRRF
jgi:hypothetical protein